MENKSSKGCAGCQKAKEKFAQNVTVQKPVPTVAQLQKVMALQKKVEEIGKIK
jgi:hypothetical protein